VIDCKKITSGTHAHPVVGRAGFQLFDFADPLDRPGAFPYYVMVSG